MRLQRALLSAVAAATLTTAFAAAPVAAQETAEAASEILHSGEWTKKSFRSSGTWTIYTEGGSTYIKLSSDFKTRGAPDLKIFLSPLAPGDTNGRNATNGSVLVAPLSSNKGEQVYKIPANVNLSDFQSVLIHCEQYSKLWSAAALS